jgi:hypothetical protein
MTVQVIPTGSDPFSTQTTSLDGVPYVLTLAYNQRCNCWYLSIATLDGTDVYDGVKLVCGIPGLLWSLLEDCADPDCPPGILFVQSSTTDASPPGLIDLDPTVQGGGRCSLLYMDAADVATIAAGGTP